MKDRKMNHRKKLIEVALPLEKINIASAREKSIRHGHPSTLHLWWARRPLAACRAVLFASLVDDPDSDPQFHRADGTLDAERAGVRRAELFSLIEELVKWENSNDEKILNAVRAEIAASIASRNIYDTKEWIKDQIICREKTWAYVCRKAKPQNVNDFLIAHAPPVLDPFCGGGSIPLEAQRLGLRAFVSDLNPVPVLITKALIEIPPKFANRPPVNPESNARLAGVWSGAQGLAEDVRYYGQWMRDEAEKRIGHLYPKIKITEEMVWGREDQHELDASRADDGGSDVSPDNKPDADGGDEWRARCPPPYSPPPEFRGSGVSPDNRPDAVGGDKRRAGCPPPKDTPPLQSSPKLPARPDLEPYLGQELTVIAWIWARTVASPDPAVGGAHVPLVRSFWLSTKKGKEAWVEPIVDRRNNSYRFEVRVGKPPGTASVNSGTKIGRGCNFRCLLSRQPIPDRHVKLAGMRGEMGSRLLAVVAEGARGRVYLPPLGGHEGIASSLPRPASISEIEAPLARDPRALWCLGYGVDSFDKLFTARQLTALTTFSDLVKEAREKVLADAKLRHPKGGSGRGSAVMHAETDVPDAVLT